LPEQADNQEEGWARRLALRLLIRHPTIDPDDITRALKLTPHLSHRVGAERFAPNGRSLGGVYRDSRWSHSATYELHGQWFVESILPLIDHLEEHGDFLRNIRASGGSTDFILAFLGDGHFSDSITAETMTRLANLSIDLGIEVYDVPQN